MYLHIIRRADWAHCQHDHPWAFTTIILRGGYEEQVGDELFVRKPGYIGYRPRTFEHRITRLLSDTAVTLVLRGPNHDSWGFRTAIGKVDWQRYVSWPTDRRVLWCDETLIDKVVDPAAAIAPANKHFDGWVGGLLRAIARGLELPDAFVMRHGAIVHPEAFCQECGRPNCTWHIDSETWNKVMPDDGIVCPVCFVEKAEAMGITPPSWRLSAVSP